MRVVEQRSDLVWVSFLPIEVLKHHLVGVVGDPRRAGRGGGHPVLPLVSLLREAVGGEHAAHVQSWMAWNASWPVP